MELKYWSMIKKGIKYQMAQNILGALGELGFRELGVKERPGLVVLRRTKCRHFWSRPDL